MQPIYLDAASTTPMLPPVWEAMRPYLFERFGNPSSSHQFGRQARRGLDSARESMAAALDCRLDEILFTSGATEANNLALFGLTGAAPGTLATSALEHPCVTGPLEQLERRGFTLDRFAVSPQGIVQIPVEIPNDLRLACLMLVNHEIGTLQPVRALVEAVDGRAWVHCDAAAAAGKVRISFRELRVNTLTLSAHKFHGPKGIGALILKKGSKLQPRTWGGHQQGAKRPGTEPVALIVGMATALELAMTGLEEKVQHVQRLRDRFLEAVQPAEPVVNGDLNRSVPHTLNLSFPGCKADALLMKLDLMGVACSTGSACSSGSLLASPVVKALGVAREVLESAMRFSFMGLLSLEEAAEAGRRVAAAALGLRGNEEWRN